MSYTITNQSIKKGNGYGQYVISGTVNGVDFTGIRTTDSMAYDYFNDEDYPEQQEEAIAHVNMKLETAFDNHF